jgi:hypothetical protein
MSNLQNRPDYSEIATLSNSELAKRTNMASDAFVQAVRHGGNVAEKAQIYNAYQDERLKRIKPLANMKI